MKVSRPCLLERLNAGLDRKLTLISALAGFGKTTPLSESLLAADPSPGSRWMKKTTIMSHQHKRVRAAVRRDHTENHVLISLVALSVTAIATRVYLELSGYPQVGNDVLHIAHALWGG